jgi:hypothetical protein
MFSVYCEQCGSVLLLGPANIVAVQNSSEGILVHFRCHAGHRGVWLAGARSGRPVLSVTGGEPAFYLATASATSDRSAGRLHRRPEGLPSTSSRPARGILGGPSTGASDAQPARSAGARPDARLAPSRLLEQAAIGDEAGLDAQASRAGTAASRTRWGRAPWRRSRQSCSGSVQR